MKFKSDIEIQAGVEAGGSTGSNGQVLSSTGSGVAWIDQSAISSASNFVYFDVKNETGSTINKGKGVMAVGTDGNSGHILIDEMVADGSIESKYFLGVLETTVDNGGFARVISFGQLDQFNTNGQNGETWSDGQVLWCDPANDGDFTITEPDGPNVKIAAAFILNSSTNGKIQVRVQANEGIHDLHDTKITSQVDGDVLVWDNTTGVWFNDSTLNVDYTNGRVGIGTISPADKLNVNGRVLAKAFRTDVNTGDYSVISRSSAGNAPLYVQSADSETNQPIAKFFYGNASPNQGSLVLNVGKDKSYFTNTNVGIGTTSPSEKLEVSEGYILSSGASTSHGFELQRTGSDTYQLRHLDGGLTVFNSTDSRKEMTFNGSGNVGIGTTTPSKRLDIRTNGVGDGITLATSTPKTFAQIINGNSETFPYGKFTMNYGDTTPVQIVALSNELQLSGGYTTGGKISFRTATSEQMRLTETGLGIGTTSPSAKLHVVGKQMITTGENASPQAEDYLFIGGDGLASSNASIYIGNRGDGTGYGWRMFYSGTGSGVNNKLKFKSENLGSPVDVITMTQDGTVDIAGNLTAANFSGTSSGTNTGDQDLSGYALTSHNHDSAYVNVTGDTMTGDLALGSNNVDFKTNGNSASPNFFGHRSANDLDSRFTAQEGGWSYTTFDSTSNNIPTSGLHNANGLLSFNTHGGDYGHQIAMTTNTQKIYFRSRNNTAWGDWYEFYHEGHKPTASEIGAQPAGTYNTVIGTDADITTSGATVIDDIYMTDGVITSHTTRNLTAADVGAATTSHNHDDRYYTETESDSRYLRSDANDVFTGNLTTGADNHITFGPNTTWGSSLRVGGNGRTATGTEMASVVTTDGNLHLDAAYNANAIYLNYYAGTNGVMFGNGANGIVARMDALGNLYKATSTSNVTATYWHSGNDGSGSGLDADTVDGLQASQFLRSDANDTTTGVLTILNSGDPKLILQTSAGDSSDWNYINFVGRDTVRDAYIGTDADGDLNLYSDKNSIGISITATGTFLGSDRILTTADEGSGNGLDADTLDGQHASAFASSAATSLYDLLPNGAFTTTYAFTSTAGTWAEVMEGNDVITSSGTYSIQVFVDDHGVGGTQYDEYYSGTMSWFATGTNDAGGGAISEIVLHRAGHAANQGVIYLRTRETTNAETNKLKLEVMSNKTYTGASNLVFKFVRLI